MLSDPAFDARQAAIVDTALSLEAAGPGIGETVFFSRLDATHIRVQTRAASQALLVLSETYYSGSRPSVNGPPARIFKTEGGPWRLPKGDSEVVLRYAPLSIIAGGAASLSAFGGVLALIVMRVKRLRAGGTAIPGRVVHQACKTTQASHCGL